MLALSLDSKAEVDTMNELAQANGGIADINPKQDLGFMYSRALTDPDGHIWEPFWMDPAAIPS
jgi:predicted lactoylglutathione lyase